MDAENRFENKRDIEQQIKKIKAKIGDCPDVNSLKVEAAEWSSRVESFIYLHGDGNEAAICQKRKVELVDIRRKAKDAGDAVERADQHLNGLQEELAELEGQLVTFDSNITIQELTALREKLQDAEEIVVDLRQAIVLESKKKEIADISSGHPLVELSQKRENLLADMAIGVKVNSVELEEVDKQISREEGLHTELIDGVITASNTINGLKRRLEGAERLLLRVKQNYKDAFSTFMVQEMERAGKKYSKLGRQLAETFMQIISLSELQQSGSPVNIFGPYTYQCKLPSFNLESCKLSELHDMPGVLFNYDTADKSSALEKESERIRRLGITIPS